MIREKKILVINLQSNEKEIEKIIKFNQEHNYEYLLQEEYNLIDAKLLNILLRNGYEICVNAEKFTLRHKNYDYDKEKIDLDIIYN